MSHPIASVIIPVWNGADYLEACLRSLLAQEGTSLEVIAVDNGSSDGSAALVADKFPTVRLIRNATNLGFAGGCNVGLRAAQGDHLLLLNQDTQVNAGWLTALVETLQDESIGLVGCKIFYPDGVTLQHAGAWFEWPLGLAHHHGYGEADSEAWSTPRETEAVTGAAIAMRREVLEKVGLLDEGFWPGYFEDSDWCLRVRKAGYKIWYQPAATLIHQESTSIRDPLLRSQFYQRGRLRFLLKHVEPERFLSEVVPAEERYQEPAIMGLESRALRQAYLTMIPEVALLLREQWQAESTVIEAMTMALKRLYHQAWELDWKRVEAVVGLAAEVPSLPLIDPVSPRLQEFRFHSSLPIVGTLISRFRHLWYNVAARWAVDELRHQQSLVNHYQDAINERQALWNQWRMTTEERHRQGMRALAKQVQEMAEENAMLAGEISALRLQLLRMRDEENNK